MTSFHSSNWRGSWRRVCVCELHLYADNESNPFLAPRPPIPGPGPRHPPAALGISNKASWDKWLPQTLLLWAVVILYSHFEFIFAQINTSRTRRPASCWSGQADSRGAGAGIIYNFLSVLVFLSDVFSPRLTVADSLMMDSVPVWNKECKWEMNVLYLDLLISIYHIHEFQAV